MAEARLQVLSSSTKLESADLSCRICLQILDDPIRLPCNHRFCKDCVDPMMKKHSSAECPICREKFDCDTIHNDEMLSQQLTSSHIRCEGCDQLILAHAMRNHELNCGSKQVNVKFVPPQNRAAPDAPNRSTFSCPYCSQSNLTADDLVEHCNQLHRHDPRDMVCPVCVSMPWGDPQLRSTNFIEHLNRRHKFEYHTYVDYSRSDEEMLQAALAASLQQS